MEDLIAFVLQLVAMLLARWLLPLLSGGRLIPTPPDAPVRPWSFRPWTRLPSGQTGVDVEFAGLIGMFVLVVAVCCLIPAEHSA